MKIHLKILAFFTVFSCVLMKPKAAFEGTVGGNVVIRCPYADDYKYTPKYLCRHPCESADVLIKGEKIDQVISSGRYSLINSVNGKFFIVIIKNLRLKDSGVYYCGIDKWFSDKLNEVHLTVHPAAPVTRSSHTTTNTIITSTWTTILTSAQNSSAYSSSIRFSSTVQSEVVVKNPVVPACVLGLLVFVVLVAFVSLCKKRSDLKSRRFKPPDNENAVQDSPDLNQVSQTVEVDYHLYDEVVTANSPAIYTTVQHCAAQEEVNPLY